MGERSQSGFQCCRIAGIGVENEVSDKNREVLKLREPTEEGDQLLCGTRVASELQSCACQLEVGSQLQSYISVHTL